MGKKTEITLKNGKRVVGAGVQLEYCIVDTVLQMIGVGCRYCSVMSDYPDHVREQATLSAFKLLAQVPNVANAHHATDDDLPQKYQIDRSKDNTEAKTDVIVVDSKRKYYKISVKMSGRVQLTSTQGVSTSKVFRKSFISCGIVGMLKMIANRKLLDVLYNLPTKLLSQEKYTAALKKKSAKKIENLSHMVTNGIVKDEYNVSLWMEKHKESVFSMISRVFDNDRRFKKNLIVEAMSGSGLHGKESASTAEYLLSPTGFHKINKSLAGKIMNDVSFGVRLKGSDITNRVTFRLDFNNSENIV